MSFNKDQEKAINHKDGPALILAGPGSGKTLVITHRTKSLIEKYGVSPNEILVITFTKAAAEEMKERFKKLMEGISAPVYFGTFHAVFFSVLRYAYNYNANNIIREEQKKQYFKEIIDKFEIEIDDEGDFLEGIISEVSLVKGELMNLDNYYSLNCSDDIFRKIYREYENRLQRANLIDFDDMLTMCYQLFVQRPDILRGWQSKFKYILIDEFQDINRVQYENIKMLAKPENNLFIVGDDDQSIYRFRGAKPEIMLNFENDYKNCEKILLSINYRSTKKIVEGALRVVKSNKKRFQKNITTTNPDGEEIKIKCFKDLSDENKQVIEDIIEYKKNGINSSDIAILFRTNTQPRTLIDKLMEYNIPFHTKDSIPNIYEHWITKNIISYIKIALGNRERGNFLQIINRPKRYVSREVFNNPETTFLDLRKYYVDKDWMIERIDKLEFDLGLLKEMIPYAAINFIRKGIGYEEYLKEYAQYRRIKVDELIDCLNEIQESSKPYKTYNEWFQHIESYTLELKKQSNNKKSKEGIELATMHSSKGLEYKVVIIVDVNEGITPHRKANTDAEIEEERRMFYVAMTRAKEKLNIYYLEERHGKELEPSRFLGELLVDKEMLTTGTEVIHKTYGKGIIKSCNDGKLVIYFHKLRSEKILDKKFCISNRLLTIK